MRTEVLLVTISAASSRTSATLDLGDESGYSISVLISGSDIAGDLKLQASVDNSLYVDVSGSTQAITLSADHIYNVTGAQYRYVRCVWTAGSGTGNITITGQIKNPEAA